MIHEVIDMAWSGRINALAANKTPVQMHEAARAWQRCSQLCLPKACYQITVCGLRCCYYSYLWLVMLFLLLFADLRCCLQPDATACSFENIKGYQVYA
jgi:hypothetical protein